MSRLGALRKHGLLALAVTCVTVFAATAYALSQTKIYRATATLQIDPKPPRPLGKGVDDVVEVGAGNYWANAEYYNTQHRLLQSQPVAQVAARELSLHKDPSFLLNEKRSSDSPVVAATLEDAAAIVSQRLIVTPIKDTRLVEVTFDDADPQRGVMVLEAVLRAYQAHNVNRTLDSTSSAVDWLQEQLEQLREDLNDSELALHRYKLEKRIASIGLDSQVNLLATELNMLNEERTSVSAKIQRAKARLVQIRKISAEELDSIPQTELVGSPELTELRRAYVTQLRERDGLVAGGKGSQHPEVRVVEGELETTRQSVTAEVESIREGAERDLAALQQEEAGLASLMKQAEREALDLNLMEIEYSRLQRTKNNNEKLYSLVLERSKEAGLTQVLRVNNITVLAPPSPGQSPVKPRLSLILAAGMVVGLGLGLSAALLRERLDRTLKSPSDLETGLGLTPLGVIPEAELKSKESSPGHKRRRVRAEQALERLVHDHPSCGFSEAFRALRTNLLFMSPDRPFRRLLITSPGPSEGKTTVACSLAISLAQAGRNVVLVDCDMRKPRLHTVFAKLSQKVTLSKSLLEPERLHDVESLKTEFERLSVLTAGPTPPNPSELLYSQSFERVLAELDGKFDTLVLDSPPLVVTDAAVISTKVDATLLVVRAGDTDRIAATQAIRSLRDVGGNLVGAVLNAMSQKHSAYGYGYGYGYGEANSKRSEESTG